MLVDCPLKAASSEDPVWIEKDKIWTYREFDELADRWVEKLLRQGIQVGSRIAVTPRPEPFIVALFFAAWRLGAVVCLLHGRLTSSGREDLLSRLQPDYVVTEDVDLSLSGISFTTIHAHLPAVFLLTSGSTTEPKVAVLSYHQLFTNALTSLSLLDLRPKDCWLLNLPLFHVGGLQIVLRSILARAAIVSNSRYPLITHISCVPTQLYRASPVYKTLRCLLVGGAPLGTYPTYLPVFGTYGLTEMGSMVLAKYHPLEGYLGFALSKRELRLASDGEILLGGECLFQGYWENGQIKSPGSWFATKDVGELDPQKGIKILGRKDWQFISGGENIQPEEIERYLLQIPGVEEAVVVPRKDPEFGARPIAYIVGSVDITALRAALVPYLPSYKIPISFIPLKKMPKKGVKIDRKAFFLLEPPCVRNMSI